MLLNGVLSACRNDNAMQAPGVLGRELNREILSAGRVGEYLVREAVNPNSLRR